MITVVRQLTLFAADKTLVLRRKDQGNPPSVLPLSHHMPRSPRKFHAVPSKSVSPMFSKELFLMSVFLFKSEKPQTIQKQLSFASITSYAQPPSCFCLP